MTRLCRCGHPKHAHQHYRSGTDCGLCACRRFRWRWNRRPAADGLVNFGTVAQPDRRPPDGSPRNYATHPLTYEDHCLDVAASLSRSAR